MDRRDFIKVCGSVLALGGLAGCSSGSNTNMSSSYSQEVYSGDILSGGPFPHKRDRYASNKHFSPSTTPKLGRNEVSLDTHSAPQRGERIQAYSRSKWQAEDIIPSRMRPMNGVKRITVHHEGNPRPNIATAPAEVERSIHQIQKTHFRILKAGDIAYHYIIDRAGRIWQGRNIKYQGAHAKHNNSHNIGIMCLGNFEIQQPSSCQVATLETLCLRLMQGYNIPANKLYGHRELKSTACPGKNLFPYVKKIRALAV